MHPGLISAMVQIVYLFLIGLGQTTIFAKDESSADVGKDQSYVIGFLEYQDFAKLSKKNYQSLKWFIKVCSKAV